MSKLAGIKEKISQLQEKLSEKLDKIALLKKWREKSASDTDSAQTQKKPTTSHSLGAIYRDGGVGDRLQVMLVILFFIGAASSTAYVAKKMYTRFKTSVDGEQIKKDYAHGFEDLQERVQAKASIISLGDYTAYVYVGDEKESMMKLDVWGRVNDADAAGFAEKHDLILRDKIVDAVDELRKQKVNLLTAEGKKVARLKIKESLNKAMKSGKVEEIFFHTLIVD